MTRAVISNADPSSAQIVRAVFEKDLGFSVVAVEPQKDPCAELRQGDWLIVDSSRPGVNGFEVAMSARTKQAERVFLFLGPGETHGESLARFCRVGVLKPPLTREGLTSAFTSRPGRPGVDELLRAAESRVRNDREQFARKVIAGLSASAPSDLDVFLTDPQTGLFNRSFTTFKLDEEFKRAARFNTPLSVILVELDGISRSGPATIVPEIASVFLNECRDIDTVGRTDAWEFLLLLPGTDADGCLVLAERLLAGLSKLAGERWPGSSPAIGLATFPSEGLKTREDLLGSVRRALSEAKAIGGPRLRRGGG
jgi:diguanylate cyclase (GGDEF)-like protein